MGKFFRGRKSNDIRKFLEAHKFKLAGHNGDDEIWSKDGCNYTVKIPSRNEDIPIGTMSHIKKMIRYCGHSDKDVLKWWKDNGYGE